MTDRTRPAGTLGLRRRWALHLVGVGVWLTGAVWLLLHYVFVRQGEFGPTTNPLEPWCIKLHGAFAFAAVWLFGLLWGVHIARLWPHKRRRWSGGILTGVFLLLIATGYLLYYVGDDRGRALISAVHWIVGLAVPAAFLWHRFKRRRTQSEQS